MKAEYSVKSLEALNLSLRFAKIYLKRHGKPLSSLRMRLSVSGKSLMVGRARKGYLRVAIKPSSLDETLQRVARKLNLLFGIDSATVSRRWVLT